MDEHISVKRTIEQFVCFICEDSEDHERWAVLRADKPTDEGLAEVSHDSESLLCQEAMVC